MLSKNKIKSIKALSVKKIRYEKSLFIAEGHKTVDDLLKTFECEFIFATNKWNNPDNLSKDIDVQIITEAELKQISLLENPQDVFAVFRMKKFSVEDIDFNGKLTIALDGVQDAGNLGTIIRIADWFGIENVVCSSGTVDIYNPKAVQATMGSLSHVNVVYTDLPDFLKKLDKNIHKYSTALDGQNIYTTKLNENAVIVMGNEGNGISPEVKTICDESLLIPKFLEDRSSAESLNVGVATALVSAEFRRQCNFRKM
ncbi:MAG: RNA methyltransferase [Paludibacteraceae bacterium]|nr:RNA methyltransferase [Paludibacteraceae bacterium]